MGLSTNLQLESLTLFKRSTYIHNTIYHHNLCLMVSPENQETIAKFGHWWNFMVCGCQQKQKYWRSVVDPEKGWFTLSFAYKVGRCMMVYCWAKMKKSGIASTYFKVFAQNGPLWTARPTWLALESDLPAFLRSYGVTFVTLDWLHWTGFVTLMLRFLWFALICCSLQMNF